MGFRVVADGARCISSGVWDLSLLPSEVQRLGAVRGTAGSRSVLLVDNPQYDELTGSLQFEATAVRVLNLGTSSQTIIVATSEAATGSRAEGPPVSDSEPPCYGIGDREFLQLVERRLSGPPAQAAKLLLRMIRAREAGDLRRGKRLNFKNTPDNFWYVVVQPTAQALSVTVRGEPPSFQPSSLLKLTDDRPGYTRFKIDRPEQVDEALRIIWKSRRRSA